MSINRFQYLLVTLLATLLLSLPGRAASPVVTVSGVVRDSISKEPVPYAAVVLTGTDRGELTDEKGRFSIKTAKPFSSLSVSAIGYDSKTVARTTGSPSKLVVELAPNGVALGEVTARPRKEKYSKKNNPAVDLMERIRSTAAKNDPRRNDAYNYSEYERITLALNNFDGDSSSNVIMSRFPMLQNHVDTSQLTGAQILNVALREKIGETHYRKSPKSEKEVVNGLRREGVDQMLDPQATQTLYEDVLREVDVYDNDITLMQNRFVSPLSRIAPDFYKYYLTDTISYKGDSCVVLTFVPHNPASFGFVGKFYVPLRDSTMFVRHIEMNVPRDINLNFIRNLRIIQDYEKAPDGSRLKTSDDMIVEAGIITEKSQLYARRLTVYYNHNFEPLSYADRVFSTRGPVITLPGAEYRTDEFWAKKRPVAISRGEDSVAEMLTDLRGNKLYYWGEQIIKILVTGYIRTGNPSKFDIGPVNTMLSFNDLEGVRLRAGGMTTGNLSRRLFAKGYVAYGTKDHRWKYMGEVEWSFHDKNYHAREFPIHSLRATHLYDVDMLGQHYLFTNPDNIFLSLRRKKDREIAYHRVSKLEYILELENNFSLQAKAQHERLEPSPFISFYDGFGKEYSHYSTASLSLTLRYAPGEKFFQTKTGRLPVNLDAPVFQLTHTFAPKGVFGNRRTLNVTELSFQKRWWFSAFGYVDMILRGGHVWSVSQWPSLLIPNANLSYTIQAESFALMNPLEFINDSYGSWDLTYWANGALLNHIPFVKKLKLREVVAFRGIYGHLSDRNNPRLNPDLFQFPEYADTQSMSSMPYMEISVGLDNILRILRLDYVWRLSYRNTPGADRSGLRLALHFSF